MIDEKMMTTETPVKTDFNSIPSSNHQKY